MTESPIDTPATKVVCESDNCNKEYASKGGMKNHFKKSHKTVEEIHSPVGRFPASNPVRALFTDEAQPSTQGNSAGQVNSPKVTSEGRFLYDICEKHFGAKEDLTIHKEEIYRKDDIDLEEIAEFSEDAMRAKELEDMVRKVRLIYKDNCHKCDMKEQVVNNKGELLLRKDSN